MIFSEPRGSTIRETNTKAAKAMSVLIVSQAKKLSPAPGKPQPMCEQQRQLLQTIDRADNIETRTTNGIGAATEIETAPNRVLKNKT